MEQAQTLCVANGHAIERLIDFRLVYRTAMQEVAEKGAVLKSPRTKVPQYSPHFVIARQANELITALEAELGLAPARRGKAVKVQQRPKPSRAADVYLLPRPS